MYDLANNRTEEDINGGDGASGGESIRYGYNNDDQLLTETETAYATSTTTTQIYQTICTYDANGNLSTQVRTGTQATSDVYTYDLRNRMTEAVIGGTETDYSYDTAIAIGHIGICSALSAAADHRQGAYTHRKPQRHL